MDTQELKNTILEIKNLKNAFNSISDKTEDKKYEVKN
jgi:hypothetical protein